MANLRTITLCRESFCDNLTWEQIVEDLGLMPNEGEDLPELIEVKVASSFIEE